MPYPPERYQCNPDAPQKEEPREFKKARSKIVVKGNDANFGMRVDCPVCNAKKTVFCKLTAEMIKNGRAGKYCRARLLAGWKQAWGQW